MSKKSTQPTEEKRQVFADLVEKLAPETRRTWALLVDEAKAGVSPSDSDARVRYYRNLADSLAVRVARLEAVLVHVLDGVDE